MAVQCIAITQPVALCSYKTEHTVVQYVLSV
jgi:hypothetical protein